MFLAAVFITAQNESNLKAHPLMSKRWCIPAMEHYSTVKRNGVLISAAI